MILMSMVLNVVHTTSVLFSFCSFGSFVQICWLSVDPEKLVLPHIRPQAANKYCDSHYNILSDRFNQYWFVHFF